MLPRTFRTPREIAANARPAVVSIRGLAVVGFDVSRRGTSYVVASMAECSDEPYCHGIHLFEWSRN